MCIQKPLSSNTPQILPMNSPKHKLSNDIDDSQIEAMHFDVQSPARTYALIETDACELEQIIDLLKQFFPKTKILDYNHTTQSTASQAQTSVTSQFLISSIENDQSSTSVSLQTFKGKVKDYLQRRYLEQTNEPQSRKDMLTKHRTEQMSSFDLSSSTLPKPAIPFKSHSFDSSQSSTMKAEQYLLSPTSSKRGLLRHYTTIDIDDTSNDAGKITFSINQPDDDDDNDDDDVVQEEEETKPLLSYRHSSTESRTTKQSNHLLLPYHPHSHDQDQNARTPYSSSMQLPLTPYSVSSDPGPFRSPWFNTPTSPFNFRFPQTQEQAHMNAQGTIAQLSTLTKMLCDEPSIFTPISPRIKTEKHQSNSSRDSSSVPPCQICRQEFNSHQMYLSHYRTHLENPCELDQSDTLYCDRSGDLRNYSCKICFKRFSRSDMLNRHLRSHSGIRPYRCTMCNTYFSRSDHLSTHLRTHTGEKPYTCPQCSYTACRRDMITRHLKIHTKQRSERKNATNYRFIRTMKDPSIYIANGSTNTNNIISTPPSTNPWGMYGNQQTWADLHLR
ncbi:unnamed protein product [Adineta ricciae]|uniref:C2H2-type domain-containing protein n=1 Tax=Adineta ricciae TaxID=249248 RepID=A0A814HGA1_ADIRI|nr:unnamed protein product [Adineta ricciae]